MLGKYIDILSAGDSDEPIVSVLTSPNSTETIFAMTSKVRKKRENFKIYRKGGRFKTTP